MLCYNRRQIGYADASTSLAGPVMFKIEKLFVGCGLMMIVRSFVRC